MHHARYAGSFLRTSSNVRPRNFPKLTTSSLLCPSGSPARRPASAGAGGAGRGGGPAAAQRPARPSHTLPFGARPRGRGRASPPAPPPASPPPPAMLRPPRPAPLRPEADPAGNAPGRGSARAAALSRRGPGGRGSPRGEGGPAGAGDAAARSRREGGGGRGARF